MTWLADLVGNSRIARAQASAKRSTKPGRRTGGRTVVGQREKSCRCSRAVHPVSIHPPLFRRPLEPAVQAAVASCRLGDTAVAHCNRSRPGIAAGLNANARYARPDQFTTPAHSPSPALQRTDGRRVHTATGAGKPGTGSWPPSESSSGTIDSRANADTIQGVTAGRSTFSAKRRLSLCRERIALTIAMQQFLCLPAVLRLRFGEPEFSAHRRVPGHRSVNLGLCIHLAGAVRPLRRSSRKSVLIT